MSEVPADETLMSESPALPAILAAPRVEDFSTEPRLSHDATSPISSAAIDRSVLYGAPRILGPARPMAPASLGAWTDAASAPPVASPPPMVAGTGHGGGLETGRADLPIPWSLAGGRYDLARATSAQLDMGSPSLDVQAPIADQRALPRLLWRPRARVDAPPVPEFDSLGRPLAPAFVDSLTQRQGPTLSTPQETAYTRERRAIDVARQLEQQRAEMIARQAEDAADAEAAFAQRQQEHEAARRNAEGEARGSYQRAVDRLAQMRIDPSRYYRQQGAVGMIGNAIAVGLGAMGQALGGGPNVAVDMMQQAIERDLRAQDQDISTAGAEVEGRRGLLSEVQRDYTSRAAALEASRAIMLREAAARSESEGAMQGSAESSANAGVLRDRLLSQAEAAGAAAEREEALALLALRQQVATIRRLEARASQEEGLAARMAARSGAPAAPRLERVTTPMMQAFDAMVASGIDRVEAATRAGLPPGLVPSGNPITSEQRSALDALDTSLRTIESGIEAGAATDDIAGAGVMDRNLPAWLQSDEGLVMRTAIADTVDLLGRLRSGAAITADEWVRFADILEGGGTERELRTGIAQIRRELSSRLGRGGARQSGSGAADAALAAAGVRQVE